MEIIRVIGIKRNLLPYITEVIKRKKKRMCPIQQKLNETIIEIGFGFGNVKIRERKSRILFSSAKSVCLRIELYRKHRSTTGNKKGMSENNGNLFLS